MTKEEIRRWMEKSKRDIKTAGILLKDKRYEECSFFCQQSIEKALKASLIKEENKLIKTHDLVFLARKLNLPQEIILECEKLSKVYIDTRYPDIPARKYTAKESKSDLAKAKKILKWLKEKIKK